MSDAVTGGHYVPGNANEVGLQLAALGRQLEAAQAALKAADLEAVRSKLEAEREFDKAYVGASTGSVEDRKANARLETYELRLTAEVKASEVRARVWEIKTIQARIDVGRTIGAGIRKETELGSYGGAA